MSSNTKIEWTEATWNPIRGCSRVSEGCRNCYAEGVANRFKGEGLPYEGLIAKSGQWNGTVKLIEDKLTEPLRWRNHRMIFVNSMSDLFHENITQEVLDRIFAVMALSPQHTFQILTKRPERMQQYLADLSGLHYSICETEEYRHAQSDVDGYDDLKNKAQLARTVLNEKGISNIYNLDEGIPLPNVWIGVSAENQETANHRIPLLLNTPAAVRWISAEPLLGAIDLHNTHQISALSGNTAVLDWVVVGGESGSSARPMHPAWVRSLRDQCVAAGVPFFFKQWGEFAPNWYNDDNGRKIPDSEWIDRVGKHNAGRNLDGRTWDEFPEEKNVSITR